MLWGIFWPTVVFKHLFQIKPSRAEQNDLFLQVTDSQICYMGLFCPFQQDHQQKEVGLDPVLRQGY